MRGARPFAGFRKAPPDYAAHGCRVLMLNGRALVKDLPKLGPPPPTKTAAQIQVDEWLKGDFMLAGER